MAEPFAYSFDQDNKSRIEAFEEDRPDFLLEGLTDGQKESVLDRWEAEMLGAPPVDDDEVNEDAYAEPLDAPVSASAGKVETSLTTAQMRALLVAAGVPVGARGRLKPEQIAKAMELA